MKLVCFALGCITFLALSGPASSWADEVDDLFSNLPASASAEVGSPAVLPAGELSSDVFPHDPAANLNFNESDAATQADSTSWRATLDQSLLNAHHASHETIVKDLGGNKTGTSPSRVDTSKASPFSVINAVPEPSAVALAALALIYFLIFGRRRSPF